MRIRPARRAPGQRAHRHVAAAASVLGLCALSGCGTSLLSTTSATGSASTTAPSSTAPSTTVPVNGEVAVAFPVVSCTSPADGGAPIKAKSGWAPTILVAPVPTSLAGKVAFYTDGLHIVLGPTGWNCATVASDSAAAPGPGTAASTTTTTGAPTDTVPTGPTAGQNGAINTGDNSTTLAVYPPNDPNPPVTGAPPVGTEGIFATWATTGTDAGVDLVCSFFTIPAWQARSAGCSTTKPAGETTVTLTPDVIEVTDPAGVIGSLAGSGGQGPSTGVVLFPQIPSAISYGTPINVAMESCSLSDASLCPTVLSDFEVREFPVPAAG